MIPGSDRGQSSAACWVSVVLVTALSWAVLRDSIRSTPFDGDESRWIASSFRYANLLLAGDLSSEKWECPDCGPWGGLSPHLGHVLIGLPLKAYSTWRLGGQEFTGLYQFSEPLSVNQANGAIPPEPIWLFARNASAVFGVLTCAAAFVVGFRTLGVAGGWIFVGLLLANRLFVASVTRAMTDVHYNLFLLCFLLAAVWFLASPRAPRWSSLACGLCAGLACSVKITGLAISGVTYCGLVAYLCVLRRFRITTALGHVALFSVAALVTIYSLNPLFWPSLSNVQAGTVWQESLRLGAGWRDGRISCEEPLIVASPQLAALARPLRFPCLFVRWSRFIDTQAREYPWVTDNRPRDLSRYLAFLQANGSVLWLLVPVGLAYCMAATWRAFREKRTSVLIAPLVYFAVNYLFILVFLKLNWDRYYVPSVVAGTLATAAVLSAGVRHAIIWGKRLHA